MQNMSMTPVSKVSNIYLSINAYMENKEKVEIIRVKDGLKSLENQILHPQERSFIDWDDLERDPKTHSFFNYGYNSKPRWKTSMVHIRCLRY